MIIKLDFGNFSCKAELFDTRVARKFAEKLPYSVVLTQWGDELYGEINVDLGIEKPVNKIPSGGIAYTNKGHLVCIFFGQIPAWPVEYIGQIIEDGWKRLKSSQTYDSVLMHAESVNLNKLH